MTYDPIDTSATDNAADGSVTTDTLESTTANVSGTVTTQDTVVNGTINGDNIVTVLDGANETGDYQIQVDGTDGTGVINFKTA
jgi:hypothetical protein